MARGQQFMPVGSGGDDRQGAHAAAPALARRLSDSTCGDGEHREIDRLGQFRRRREAGHSAEFRACPRVHGVDRTGVSGGEDVAKDDRADRRRTAARPDDGDRSRPQQRTEALDIRRPLPLPDGLQISVVLGQRNGEFDDPVRAPAVERQPRIGEQALHGMVLGQHVGVEGAHAPGTGQRGEILQQQGSHTASVHSVRDDHPDLGDSLIAGGLVARHADELAGHPCAHRGVPGSGAAADAVRHLPADAATQAEEPQVEVFR
jgi:hypothetical protein